MAGDADGALFGGGFAFFGGSLPPLDTEEELYITPELTPICVLECKEAFEGLEDQEKLYAHYVSLGSWGGALACLAQTSPETPPLFLTLFKLFTADPPEQLEAKAKAGGVSDTDWTQFMQFVACFFGNMGNYLDFGDTKFVPRCSKEAFTNIIKTSSIASTIVAEWEAIADLVFDLSKERRQLGLEGDGISAYYSPDITKEEIGIVQDFLASQDLGDQAYNSRLFRSEGSQENALDLVLASAEVKPPVAHKFKDTTINVKYGDHAPFMAKLVANLEEALKHVPAEREAQREMVRRYMAAFRGGSIREHKESQRAWIKDKAPPVETNIGFIESYRDPFGVRGEFEGFVAVVNRAQSAKFQTLVDQATAFISLLPWPPAFEKDSFLRPDFTSLDVVSFASRGIPAGINIPNYDDIRQSEGFKNVSLGNVLSASAPTEKITFLSEEDSELFRAFRAKSFEVQVAIHELLGHGSGKLLREEAEGRLNFSINEVVHPLTGGKITSYYKPGQTWDAVFGPDSSSYEECRAEAVGIFLCTVPAILAIFGHHCADGEVPDVVYTNWLLMVRAGVLGLEYYTPETKSWRQAHMQARYCILRVLLEAGGGLLELRGEGDATQIFLDRSKILTVGKEAVGQLLLKLNVYKATADHHEGLKMYQSYTSVPDDLLALRQVVLAQKQPRKLFVQCSTVLGPDGKVSLQEFEPTPEGLVRSFTERFKEGGPLGDLIGELPNCGQFPHKISSA